MRTHADLALLVIVALFLVPACGAQNATNVTVTTNVTAVTTTAVTTVVTTPVTNTTVTTTPAVNTTTQVPVTTTVMTTTLPATTVVTPVPTTVATLPPTSSSTGDVSVASTPLGASILIDGTYYGTTPANLTGIPAGNHILRLALSGYYDYEGTLYVVPGQVTSAFGNLPPLGYNPAPSPTIATPAPTTLPETAAPETQQPTPTTTTAPLENPTVLAAVIGGAITAVIGAAATIFTHVWKKN